ncbi:MAG TPA: YkgJ family cysteine cluster protein [Tepidisphaeraceae bacterium]|nr:YkgJ family cysteine cluster protein [Tepidisphaeraceae bacterium]
MSTRTKLPVLPWYADGLSFTCTQCGNCCTGGPGYVWISREEIVRLAEHLGLTPEQTVEKYCRKIDGKFSLNESRNSAGQYDCVFLVEQKPPRAGGRGGAELPAGATAPVTKRGCGIYAARPLQCRTWPFWPENLTSRRRWDEVGKRCPGTNVGRSYTQQQIESIRDAADWPAKPPTSR